MSRSALAVPPVTTAPASSHGREPRRKGAALVGACIAALAAVGLVAGVGIILRESGHRVPAHTTGNRGQRQPAVSSFATPSPPAVLGFPEVPASSAALVTVSYSPTQGGTAVPPTTRPGRYPAPVPIAPASAPNPVSTTPMPSPGVSSTPSASSPVPGPSSPAPGPSGSGSTASGSPDP